VHRVPATFETVSLSIQDARRTIPYICSAHQNFLIIRTAFCALICAGAVRIATDVVKLGNSPFVGLSTLKTWALVLSGQRALLSQSAESRNVCGSNCGEELLEQHLG
jgi:hypothetical protein